METSAPVCEEDQPCWDCATMGNHICGTTFDLCHPLGQPGLNTCETTAVVAVPRALPVTGTTNVTTVEVAALFLALGILVNRWARR